LEQEWFPKAQSEARRFQTSGNGEDKEFEKEKERNHLGGDLYFKELVTAHATRLFNVAVEVRSEADSNQEQGDAAGGEVAIHLWSSLEKTTGDISRPSKGR
jgi:hypothetical protein